MLMTSRANAERNTLSDRVVVEDQSVAALNASFPVVPAIIEAKVLAGMASIIKECVARRGLLIPSSVLDERASKAIAAFEGMGLVRIPRYTGWVVGAP